MTSRRSMTGHAERLSRALQFVPGHVGGRVASAQPIRRRGGTLRSASVGAAMLPAYISSSYGTLSSGTSTSAGSGDDGDMLVVIACAVTVTPSLPAGWTSAGSGTSGALSYVVGHTIQTPSTDHVLTVSGTGYTGASSTLYSAMALFRLRFRPSAGSLQVADSVAAGASSLAPQKATAGLSTPFAVTFSLDSASGAGSHTTDVSDHMYPATDANFRLYSAGNRALGLLTSPPDLYQGGGLFTGETLLAKDDGLGVDAYGDPRLCDWVSLGLGFA